MRVLLQAGAAHDVLPAGMILYRLRHEVRKWVDRLIGRISIAWRWRDYGQI
jgi:hypothetical protein